MQRLVVRARQFGDHVDEQLLDRACLLDAAADLPDRGRMPRGHGRAQCRCVALDPVGHPRQPLGSPSPSRRRCRWPSGRTRRASICNGDAITLSSPTSSSASCSSICTPSRSRIAASVTTSTSSSGVTPSSSRSAALAASGARGYTVGGVVGDVVVVPSDAHFCCGTGIKRGERREIVFGYGIDGGGAPTQGRAWRRCCTCSDRRSGIRW